MGKLSKDAVFRALSEAKDIPNDWNHSTYGAPHYELHLRMSRLQELEYDFIWPDNRGSSRTDFSLPDPSLILVLDVSLNDLTTLEPHQLSPFLQLRYLNASLNRIHRFNGIEVLHRLHFLDLSHNNILRLTSELSNCRLLVKLDLSVNQIDSVSSMPTLSNLRSLNLRNNKLTSLSGLQSLPMLEELFVENNKITDILTISVCRNLQTIEAANNRMSSLTAVLHSLRELPRLQTLSLYGNPVEKVVGYQLSLVNNTTVCVLDNVTVRSHDKPMHVRDIDSERDGERLRWMVGHDGLHWLPVVDTTRLAFERQMAKKKRQTDDEISALHNKATILREEYKDYEMKTKRDMNNCLANLRSVAYDDPRSFNYDYFTSDPKNSSHQKLLLPPEEGKFFPFGSNSRLEKPFLRKPFYGNIVDTNEVLRHTYLELSKLQQHQKNEQEKYEQMKNGPRRNGLSNV